jgi:iron-sulfur cluster assembly accessory protein
MENPTRLVIKRSFVVPHPSGDTMQTAELTSAPSTADKAAEPMFRLTERAVAQVKEVIRAQKFEGYVLTVRVVPSGCSGFGYDLNLLKEGKPNDITWEQDGVKIATDGLSRQYLQGTEVDYLTGLQGAGFKFLNPNAKNACGCGQSFST